MNHNLSRQYAVVAPDGTILMESNSRERCEQLVSELPLSCVIIPLARNP
jgi:hypothetical protein